MRIALLSDLHANLEALDACLRHAKQQSIGRFAILGDLIGYGADPVSVIERVGDLVAGGAIALKGNHDEALSRPDASLTPEALAVIDWTRVRLSSEHLAFIAALPLMVREHDACFVHASADAPHEWRYVSDDAAAARSIEAADAVWCVVGHVHDQMLYYQGAGRRLMAFTPSSGTPVPVGRHRRWLAVAGSVGQPRDGNTAAAYAVLDTTAASLTFFRVPYDHASAAAKIRAAGLPERFALRLEGH
ncbi:MAG TPA: metallophosphoesterase family protein [Burkholderiaceae bacterium]|nr:metallophosphoesterase family protein [Burkholderiaceae bacterium]